MSLQTNNLQNLFNKWNHYQGGQYRLSLQTNDLNDLQSGVISQNKYFIYDTRFDRWVTREMPVNKMMEYLINTFNVLTN